MVKSKHTPSSMFTRIAIPFFAVVIALTALFYGSTVLGGVTAAIDGSADSVLQGRVNNKGTDIASTFSTRWSNMDETVHDINSKHNALGPDGLASFSSDSNAQRQLLIDLYPQLVSMLRANEVTGVFLIVNGSDEYPELSDTSSISDYGLCIRDYDPSSDYTDKEDLLISRCPASLVSSAGCSIDSSWESMYTFNADNPGDYFFEPLKLAYENPDINYDSLAYLSGPHSFDSSDRSVISYSVPLVDPSGHPYAVLGVELTIDYLKSLVPTSNFYSSEDSCYAFVQYNTGESTYKVVAVSGPLFQQAFGAADTISGTIPEGSSIISFNNELNGLQLNGCLTDIPVYNNNTPFEDQHFAVMGMVKNDTLYSISTLVQSRLALISLFVLIVGIIAVFIMCRGLTAPIRKLSDKVRAMDKDSEVELDTLGISEIDDLVHSIEDLSNKISRNMVRTEFFSRMSHDMRTPMNAVIGFSSPELISEATPEQLREYMEKINTSGTYLLGLINEVLDMTKIESKRMELRVECVESSTLWSDTITIIEELAKDKGVEFSTYMPAQNEWIMADRQHVDQVFMNLLSNAVKFTPTGGTVTYSVTCTQLTSAHVSYRMKISDTGCGIGADFQEKMYEPFLQEHEGEGGTGLGLAITKQIVALMNGSISCESTTGKGTIFTLDLSFPLAEEKDILKVNGNESGDAEGVVDSYDYTHAALSGKNVLLCEDNEINAQIATMLLEKKSMVVQRAANGVQAIDAFEQSPEHFFDIILMDIRMPVMDGLEAVKALRALDRSDAGTIPIIAMTANAFDEDVRKSRAAGMDDHLSKPIDPTILYAAIEKHLRTS